MPEPTQPIEEKAFASQAGLAPALVADLRRRVLTETADFRLQKNRVLLNGSGVGKLLAALQADPKTSNELVRQMAALQPQTLRVTKHFLNARLLQARTQARPQAAPGETLEIVTVRVRSSMLHPVGSEIRAIAPADGGRVWKGLPPRRKNHLRS